MMAMVSRVSLHAITLMLLLGTGLLLLLSPTAEAAAAIGNVVGGSGGVFVCKEDGHFGDEVDCSKYWHCANGRPMPGYCPGGLFWNQGKTVF